MPLFMDRHDLPGLTAEDLARAHASDLQVADKHDVQFLSYWFDADSGGVFCLARAPAPENLVSVHRESHGLVPNEIISVSEDAVLRFLGVVRNPSNHTEVTSSFRTILFTDIEGSPRSQISSVRRVSSPCSPSTTSSSGARSWPRGGVR